MDPMMRLLYTLFCEINTCKEKQQDTCFQATGHLAKDGTGDLKMIEPQKPTLASSPPKQAKTPRLCETQSPPPQLLTA